MGYAYEQPFRGPVGSVGYPDFTVPDTEIGRTLLVEHLGMLDRLDYVARWKAKEAWYVAAGVGEAGGSNAEVALLTTTELGGFDAADIKKRLASALGL